MNIVVLDGYTLNPGDNPWDGLAELGTLTVHDRTRPEEIVARARDAEILLTNKTPLTAQTLEQLPRLRFIAVLATGYNVVDTVVARARGVPVANVPEYGTDSVAQHVFALLLELCHHVGLHDTAVKAGEWTRAEDFCFWKTPLIELTGATMGIVGYGRIGQRVGELATAFGMQLVVTGRPGSQTATVAKVFETADVVSLHCPLTADNQRFVNRALLQRMKPSAFFINTARGALVDEAALAEALNAGTLAGAAVDVVSSEPMRAGNPLLGARNCIVTPHIAWAALAARRRLMVAAVRNVQAFFTGRLINIVN